RARDQAIAWGEMRIVAFSSWGFPLRARQHWKSLLRRGGVRLDAKRRARGGDLGAARRKRTELAREVASKVGDRIPVRVFVVAARVGIPTLARDDATHDEADQGIVPRIEQRAGEELGAGRARARGLEESIQRALSVDASPLGDHGEPHREEGPVFRGELLAMRVE